MNDMFWVEGVDGREYGPVPLETLREWVREGRVVPTTRVRGADQPFTPARDVPGLAGLFAPPAPAAAPPRPGPPATLPPAPGTAAREQARLPAAFDAPAFFGEAWRLLTLDDYLLLSVQLLLMCLINAVPLGGLVLGGPLLLGYWRSLLRRVDGQAVDLGTLFSGFDRFGDAFLLQLVAGLLISLGTLFCIVPGIFLALMWSFAYPVLAETPLAFWPAMERSARLTEGRRLQLFLFFLIAVPVTIVGLLACCVGLFPAAVLCNVSLAIAYRWAARNSGDATSAP